MLISSSFAVNPSSFLHHTTIATLQLNLPLQHSSNPFPTLNHQQSTCLTSGTHLLHHHVLDCILTAVQTQGTRRAGRREAHPRLSEVNSRQGYRGRHRSRRPCCRCCPAWSVPPPPSPQLHKTLLTLHKEGDKSATQKLGDATRGGSDDASAQGQGILKQAQEAAGNAAQYVADTLNTKK